MTILPLAGLCFLPELTSHPKNTSSDPHLTHSSIPSQLATHAWFPITRRSRRSNTCLHIELASAPFLGFILSCHLFQSSQDYTSFPGCSHILAFVFSTVQSTFPLCPSFYSIPKQKDSSLIPTRPGWACGDQHACCTLRSRHLGRCCRPTVVMGSSPTS